MVPTARGKRADMADLTYYAAKIAECQRLLESSNDPLYRNVYQAMANEFAEKYAELSQRIADEVMPAVPPSPLLHQIPLPQAALPDTAALLRADRRRRRRARSLVS